MYKYDTKIRYIRYIEINISDIVLVRVTNTEMKHHDQNDLERKGFI